MKASNLDAGCCCLGLVNNRIGDDKDVKSSDWFYNNIDFVNKHGIMNGVGNGLFAPNTTLTRAMAVTILFRLDEEYYQSRGDKLSFEASGFTDVLGNVWYSNPVSWAKMVGIISGKSEKVFDPNGAITRAEFAAILYRFFNFKKIWNNSGADAHDIPVDYDSVPEYAKDAVVRLFSAEIIKGRPGKIFDPYATITRAETAAMIERFTERVFEDEYNEVPVVD